MEHRGLTFSDRLVMRLEGVTRTSLPDRVLVKTKACILDAIGCACAGQRLPWSKAVTATAAEAEVGGTATVWLLGEKRSLLTAIFANSAASHATLLEDVHAESASHPGTVVVPAAVGLGEHLEASGMAVIEAVVMGYEAMTQVGRLALTPAFQERGFRPSSVFGPIGAAAAAGRLLGLEGSAYRNSLALATNMSGGLVEWSFAGTMEAGYENGTAARNGVQAALLAAQGVEGAPTAFEGRGGFFNAFSGGLPAAASQWPQHDAWEIENVYFKPYGSCVFTQEAIEAARRLVHSHPVQAADIRRITIKGYSLVKHYPGVDNPGPFPGPATCVVSSQFAVAAVFLDGDFAPDRYAAYSDSAVTDLAARITVEVDPAAEQRFPAVKQVTLLVELMDGSVFKQRVDDLSYPSPSEVEARFRRGANGFLDPATIEHLVEKVRRLEELTRINEVTDLLRSTALGVDALA